MSRYVKKGIKDPLYEFPNRHVLVQVAGAQYDIIPYKGIKGKPDAEPINGENMEDIEDALVMMDNDLDDHDLRITNLEGGTGTGAINSFGLLPYNAEAESTSGTVTNQYDINVENNVRGEQHEARLDTAEGNINTHESRLDTIESTYPTVAEADNWYRDVISNRDIGWYDGTSNYIEDYWKKITDMIVAKYGDDRPFEYKQMIYEGNQPKFWNALASDIYSSYGFDIETSATDKVVIEISGSLGDHTSGAYYANNYFGCTYITVRHTMNKWSFSKMWAHGQPSMWLDRQGAPAQEIFFDLSSRMINTQAYVLDVKHRDYISGITIIVSDWDDVKDKWGVYDSNIRYIPRVKTATKPSGFGGSATTFDTMFEPCISMTGSITSSDGSPDGINHMATSYLEIHYANSGHTYPHGICIEGLLTEFNPDQVVSAVVVHYGDTNWIDPEYFIAVGKKAGYAPSTLNQPIEEREELNETTLHNRESKDSI